jgi:hypothetical protein
MTAGVRPPGYSGGAPWSLNKLLNLGRSPERYAHGTARTRVPRYYFHLYDDLDCPDTEGAELPDLEAARAKVSHEARLLMGDLLHREGRLALHHRIEIEDDDGIVVETVHFRDVVAIEN